MHFRKASAVVNFTIYVHGGFRELPRLQFWLPQASWSLCTSLLKQLVRGLGRRRESEVTRKHADGSLQRSWRLWSQRL